MHSGISVIGLLILAALAVLLVGTVILFIASPRSRGPILGIAALLVVGGGMALYTVRSVSIEYQEGAQRARIQLEAQRASDRETQRLIERVSRGEPRSSTQGSVREMAAVESRAETSGTAVAQDRSRVPSAATESRSTAAAEIEPPPGVSVVEVPDDLAAWRREGDALGYRTPSAGPQWLADAAGGERRATQIRNTFLRYWAPGTDGRLAAYSGSWATRDEARAEAVANAQTKLAALAIRPLLEEGVRHPADDLVRLARRVVADTGALEISDEARQSGTLRGSSHVPIERAAVLFDADASRLERLTDQVRTQLQRGWLEKQRARWMDLLVLGGGAFLAFGVFVVYSLVNAGSKGWFAWPLRLTALCAIVAVVTVVWFLRAKFAVP